MLELNDRLHPFVGLDVWRLLSERARRTGDRPFLVWQPYATGGERTWTYAELHRAAASVGSGLVRRGVNPGDRVLVHLENCPEFVIAWFACAAVGAVAVTTNARSAGAELAYFAEDCEAVGAITQPKFAELVSASAPWLRWQCMTDDDGGAPVGVGGDPDSFDALAGDPDDLPARPVDPLAPMSVQYTSGTTSRPKGVLWTHANALWGARVNAVHEDLHPDDCHLVYHPLFHTNGLAFSMLASLWVGARFVLVPKWSTSRFWDVSLRHRCTWLSLMGLSSRVLADGDAPWGHHYRLFGGALCDTPLDAAYGVKTIGWWAMTETISHGVVGSPYTPDRPMSMGRPAPEYRIAVVGDDGATPVDVGETGHLLVKGVRGLSLFAEYLNQPQATADAFDERGWFRTGDLVTVHPDGYLSFADRAKDVLRVGAENVAASEVERVLIATGSVVEAAVVSRPDDKLDEVPVAFVVARRADDGLAQALIEACTAELAPFKVPRAVYCVRELPRSTLGKVNKVELRRVAEPGADRSAAEARWLQILEAGD